MRPRSLLSIFFLLPFFWLTAQVPVDLKARLDKTLDSMRIKIKSVALSGAMVLPDGNVWTAASGTAAQDPFVAADPNQLYLIGSVTKTLISAAILQLAEKDQLALDDKISIWITRHPNIDTNITIRHLLRHQSGLYDILSNQALNIEMLTHQQAIFDPWNSITRYLQPALFSPGTQWSYSNTNYFLLGIIIQKITGQTYYEYLREHIFEPQGLSSFAIPAYEELNGDVCHVWLDTNGDQLNEDAHIFYSNYLALNSMAGAAGGYYSTSADLARWIYNFIRGEVVNGEWVKEAQKTVFASGVPNGTYGLGLMKKAFLGYTGYGHGGDLGYSASAWYFPDKEVSIAVLNNDANNNSWALVPVIQALLKTYNDWASTTTASADLVSSTDFLLYPNPAINTLFVKSDAISNIKNIDCSIYNAQGIRQSVQRFDKENGSVAFEVSQLPAGMYQIVLHVNGVVICTQKFVKS